MKYKTATAELPLCHRYRLVALSLTIVMIGVAAAGCAWNRSDSAQTPPEQATWLTKPPDLGQNDSQNSDAVTQDATVNEISPFEFVSHDGQPGRIQVANAEIMPPTPPPDFTAVEQVDAPVYEPTAPVDHGAFVIDLATALRLGGAGALQIELARERTFEAQVAWSQARFAILPSLRFVVGYNHHDGRIQDTAGDVIDSGRSSLFVGGGAGLGDAPLTGASGGPARLFVDFSLADAHFEPLAKQQLFDAAAAAESSQTNDTLRDIAVSYANLVEARSQLANTSQGLAETNNLVQLTTDFANTGKGAQAEVYRAKTERAYWRRTVEDARRRSLRATAELARILRLDPDVQLMPAEEQLAPVEMVQETMSLEDLIGTGLAMRPEMAHYQAMVEERMIRLRQECVRPFIPYIHLGASGGSFAGGDDAKIRNDGGRSDVDALAVWELKNLGIGNYLLRRRRDSQLLQAEMEVERLQDQIIAEVIKAAADVASFRRQMATAREGVESANISYRMNLERIHDAVGLPLELVQAIRAQTDAQIAYAKTISDYNRAQFQLMHALGQPPFMPGQ